MGCKIGLAGLAALTVALWIALPGLAGAQPSSPVVETPGTWVVVEPAAVPSRLDTPPSLDLTTLEPLARLAPAKQAARGALEALQTWNRATNRPLRNGFLRPLPRPRTVVVSARDLTSFGATLRAGGQLAGDGDRAVWVASIEVEAAWALRAHLRIDSLPDGARLWTRGADGRPKGPFGRELLAEGGDLWLPPVEGSVVSVEIAVPRSSLATGPPLRARIDDVMELVDLDGRTDLSTRSATACEIDGKCVDSATLSVIEDFRQAVARLVFTKGSFSYLCSGSLVNDTDESTTIPYLLTANHCFSTQASASSLVAYFDDYPSTCNGTPPSLGSLPQVVGSTLLATGTTSDFTLVQLSGLPAGTNYLLGWTTRELVEGEILYMLSHPDGRRQAFSKSAYTEFPAVSCGTFSGLFYADQVAGSTLGGSSGAPLIVDEGGGEIVGQLYGFCYEPGYDDCDYSTYNEIDGAFRITYPSVAEYLAPTLPEITVSAIDDQAAEPSDPGAFRISRTGSTASAAEVAVSVGGSATDGVDYLTIGSPVTIPAGQASLDVLVIPIDDTSEEPAEDVTLEVVSSPGYEIGSPYAASVTLADDEGPDCRSVVVASQTLAFGDEAACGRLHAGPDLTLAAGGSVHLYGGVSVVLYDGFSTGAGASLSISTCGQNLCAAGATHPSSADCHPCVAQVCAADASCCTTQWSSVCVGEVGSICGLTCS